MKHRLNRCWELEKLTRGGHDRPILACGRVLLDIDPLANVVRPPAADLVDQACRGAVLLLRCTGKLEPLWSPVIMSGACVAQMLVALERIRNTSCSQAQMNECHRLFFCFLEHRWSNRCEVVRYQPNVQAPMFCYQMEAALRLTVTIKSVREEAAKLQRPAEQIAAWIQMNRRGLLQRYAQEYERNYGTGAALYKKGDLIQLIKSTGGFEQNVGLWDSPHNLKRLISMQEEALFRRSQLGAPSRLYGGLVTGYFVEAGGVGSPGQPQKFYASLPQLTTLVLFADEDVDAMVGRHFKLGMPRLELGQYLIAHGAQVDMSKEGKRMLQVRERGAQRVEPQTGRRGLTTALQQISTYRSVVGSEMGDPVPMQHLPAAMDEVVPPSTAVAFPVSFFRRPQRPAPKFPIDRPAAGMLARPQPQLSRTASPAGSRASSVLAGEGAREVSARARSESTSPAGSQPTGQHESRDKTKKTTPTGWAAAPTRPTGRGGFDTATGPGALAGPSHGGFQPPGAGHKRPGRPSKSPMAVPHKI
ncbi:MAG: hypothetical protein GY835_22405, partial [bacterium]|nr:hypothetical protein [bacterium]